MKGLAVDLTQTAGWLTALQGSGLIHHRAEKSQPANPSTAWNIDWRAWLMIWPFHSGVSV